MFECAAGRGVSPQTCSRSAMAQLEAILDPQSMRVIEFLRRHPCVVGVDYVRRAPSSASALAAWHEVRVPAAPWIQ